jgi:hypothetical protein
MKRTDANGRTWEYNDCEGTWEHGEHIIGCGGKNGRKYMFWSSDDRYPEEFTTLKAAMASV